MPGDARVGRQSSLLLHIRPAPLPRTLVGEAGVCRTLRTDWTEDMNVRPLHDRLLIRRIVEGEQKSGAIIIPDSAKEKPQRGTVVAAGNGKLSDDGTRLPLDVKVGNVILFGKYASEITVGGEDYVILREEEVLAVLDDGDANAPK